MILKAECGKYSVRFHVEREYPAWSFHGLLVYDFDTIWFLYKEDKT